MSARKELNPKKSKLHKVFVKLKVWALSHPLTTALLFIATSWFFAAIVELKLEADVEGGNIKTAEDAIWWGIVTFLTVGYGDRYPVTAWGRFFASLLMVSGVIAIAIVTAKISSFFLERALRERRGQVDPDQLKGHFIICGWKENMAELVNHILESNPNMRAEQLVLVNNTAESELETLLSAPGLKGMKSIRGDFFNEMVLLRAAPERALRVMILADATVNAAGVVPTATEADARTVMTAMTLNNIAKGVPVVAEIIDSQMDQYLRLAHVSEIIYARDFSRMLLAMASTGVGVTNIFQDLINPSSPHFLKTKEIPPEFFNQSYGALEKFFESHRHQEILLGVLENSGNSHIAKEKALRKAQLTPNVNQLVANLKEVKELKFNRPLLRPSKDFVVTEDCMAIVIERHAVAKTTSGTGGEAQIHV